MTEERYQELQDRLGACLTPAAIDALMAEAEQGEDPRDPRTLDFMDSAMMQRGIAELRPAAATKDKPERRN